MFFTSRLRWWHLTQRCCHSFSGWRIHLDAVGIFMSESADTKARFDFSFLLYFPLCFLCFSLQTAAFIHFFFVALCFFCVWFLFSFLALRDQHKKIYRSTITQRFKIFWFILHFICFLSRALRSGGLSGSPCRRCHHHWYISVDWRGGPPPNGKI